MTACENPISFDAISSRVAHTISELSQLGPALAEAIRSTIGRLWVHRRQRTGPETFYTELCSAYIATMGHSPSTARRAWDWLSERVLWLRLRYTDEVPAAVKLRRLADGQRYGQHLILGPDATETLRRLVDALDLRVGTFPLAEAIARQVERRAGRDWARCPFHDDRTPSLQLNPPRPGYETGVGYCYGCQLPVTYLRDGDQVLLLGKALSKDPLSLVPIGMGGAVLRARTPEREAPEDLGVEPVGRERFKPGKRRGEHVDVKIHRSGPKENRQESRGTGTQDLIGLLQQSERNITRRLDREWRDWDPDEGRLPDHYITVNPARPVSFHHSPSGGCIPTAWQTERVRYLLFDLDDAATEAPPGGLARLEQALARFLAWHSDLFPGPAALLQTGPRGLQLVVRLRADWAPCSLDRDGTLRRWMARLGPEVQALARAAGWEGITYDPSSNDGRRKLMRIPAYRVAKDAHGGGLCTSRLLWVSR